MAVVIALLCGYHISDIKERVDFPLVLLFLPAFLHIATAASILLVYKRC